MCRNPLWMGHEASSATSSDDIKTGNHMEPRLFNYIQYSSALETARSYASPARRSVGSKKSSRDRRRFAHHSRRSPQLIVTRIHRHFHFCLFSSRLVVFVRARVTDERHFYLRFTSIFAISVVTNRAFTAVDVAVSLMRKQLHAFIV